MEKSKRKVGMQDCGLQLEHWIPLKGYEGIYEISNVGAIRSIASSTQWSRWKDYKGKRFNCSAVGSSGYVIVTLCINRKETAKSLHRLVLENFVGTCDLPVVRHLDGNKRNNRLSNLAWGTHKDNSDDMQRHKTVRRGLNHPRTALTKQKLLEVIGSNESANKLSKQLEIDRHLIVRIRKFPERYADSEGYDECR